MPLSDYMSDDDWQELVAGYRTDGASDADLKRIVVDAIRETGYVAWPDNPECNELWIETSADRIVQGVPVELTDEQLDFIGAVIASSVRRRKGGR